MTGMRRGWTRFPVLFSLVFLASLLAAADPAAPNPVPPETPAPAPAPLPDPPVWLGVYLDDAADGGVQVIGVCFSPDHGDGWLLQRTGGYHFPIGSDLATTRLTPPPETPVAIAYDVDLLPRLVVTDRRRRVRHIMNEPSYDVQRLRAIVEARLAEEPE